LDPCKSDITAISSEAKGFTQDISKIVSLHNNDKNSIDKMKSLAYKNKQTVSRVHDG
jgi:hypothetical protein